MAVLPLRSLIHYFAPDGNKYKPTIPPTSGFSASADAEHLKAAVRGLGTNEKAIINILGRRTAAERVAIRDAFRTTFSKELHDVLDSELSGNFKKMALLLIDTPWTIMADAVRAAVKGLGTKERVLIEVFASCSNDDIEQLKIAYNKNGKRDLDKDVASDTSGNFRAALQLLLTGRRDEPPAIKLKNLSPENVHELINLELAETDAKEIHAQGEGRPGTNENRFMRPILNRSPWQLNATNEAYKKLYGKSLNDAIKNETSDHFKDLLLAVVKYAIDRPTFTADLLRFVMKGAGTNDTTLMRTLALHADIDLESAKHKFAENEGKPLDNWIEGDTSGDYKLLCLALAQSSNTS